MSYSIPDVPLIPQQNDMACWYASAQMVIQWRRNRTQSSEAAHPDPSEVPALQREFAAAHGLPWAQTELFARRLGLVPVMSFMTPSPAAIEGLLMRHGPLWFQGLFPSGHAVVITGVSEVDLSINDPWPPAVGSRRRVGFGDYADEMQPLPVPGGSSRMAPNLLALID
jgi:hypothetical protein